MADFSKELSISKVIALKAGDVMLKYFDIDQEVEDKEDGSPVTIADKLINDLAIEELAKSFPEDVVIGEERSTGDFGSGRLWYCDPIDGTIGYTWGSPTAMFSLALVIDGEPVVAVTYDPFLKRMYSAVKGQGSLMNEKKLSVSNFGLDKGVIAVTSGIYKIFARPPFIKALIEAKAKMACFSGAVYKSCLVARGRFAGYIEHGVNGHDTAAIQLIVEEAGGKVTGIDGKRLDYTKPFEGVIVSNGIVHDQLMSFLAKGE